MEVLSNIEELIRYRRTLSKSVGFVPTMGALHEGHRQLFLKSKKENSVTIGSIFVNPLQFGPNEDLAKYPRTLDADLKLLRESGVDAVFTPSSKEMTPSQNILGISMRVPAPLTQSLCGKYRPGHFEGVMTIVLKLFQLAQPSRAYFGWKDAQQCIVLQKMVEEFCIPVRLQFEETVREADGLAMSSRNRYLSPEEREVAPIIYQALVNIEKTLSGIHFSQNETIDADSLLSEAKRRIESQPLFQIQYLEARNLKDLSKPEILSSETIRDGVLVAAAILVSEKTRAPTRLIDNIRFIPSSH